VSSEDNYAAVMDSNGAFHALKEAKEAGKIIHIGVSCHNLDMAAKAIRSGNFDVIEIAFSAVENSRQHFDIIKLAKEMDVGVVVMKPLSGGNLSNVELAIRYVLQQDISCAIAGVRKPEEVLQNAKQGWVPKPLSAAEEKILLDEAKELGQTFCRRCGYCLPCTVGIDIPSTFIVDNQARAAEKRGETRILEIIRKQYNMFPIKADACVEDGVCEERCPYSLPIMEMLKAALKRLQL
jgi:predicted aldo/keto reductase-like oxidoreductase